MALKLLALVAFPSFLLACGQEGSAAEATAAAAASKPLDIAGIRIGMPASEVEATLTRGGWTWRPYAGDTWKQAVNRIVVRQKGDFAMDSGEGTGGWTGMKGAETLEVSLHPTEAGGRVESVTYRAPIAGRSSAEFRAGLYSRYGKPSATVSRIYRDGAVWCSNGDVVCAGSKGDPTLPNMSSAYDDGSRGRVALLLVEGSAATAAWTRERDDAVKARSRSSSSF